ncbi:hypothetical protein BUALT_Bualt02G0144500 [Buddleja alternifolia]|uniref:NB-ARC domain-containing protein n=1 Tax=Buddleja alternifolia TaxID=168488 RepID=A0AAV6Y6X1_9LAMI|nr:hypothetical protein BUALT_Bualt02G0144500 [Buddleja alternifolia]
MSYAALISLKLTIERLLNSSHISITPHPYPEIECVYKEIGSLQQFLGQISEHKESVLDRQIRVAICKLENALESHVSNRFLLQSETFGDESYPLNIITLDLQEVEQEINFFTETVNKMEEEYKMVLSKPSLLSEDYDSVSSRIDFGGKKLKMVGLQDELTSFIGRFTNEDDPYYLKSVAIVGMAGVGKTSLANLFYEDPSVMNYFDCRVWINAGPKIQLEEVLLGILAQTNPDHFNKNWVEISAKELAKEDFGKSMTTRLEKVAHCVTWPGGFHKKQFLSEEESWYLFNEKVFSKDSCQLELEKAGKKIVENCEGLPLAIIAVGKHLSMAEKTIEYWNKVAEQKVEVFNEEDEKVLYLSYNYLPEHLKACFLYTGLFPHDYEISMSKIIMLWSAEGFLEPDARKTTEDIARDCLEDLVSSNLLLVRQRGLSGRIKTCGLHYVFQIFVLRKPRKRSFSMS